MVSIDEEVEDLKIHVFKWNEKLHKIKESNGLFMFCISYTSKKTTLKRVGFREIYKTFSFELENLSTPHSTECLVSHAIEARKFFSEDTAINLRKDVSAYLLSCFKFDIEKTMYQKPTIVIVVDVYISRTMTYTPMMSPSLLSWSKQVKKRKVVAEEDDDDDKGDFSKGLKQRKLSVEKVEEIRGVLLTDFEEPISSHECQGLCEVEAVMKVKEFDGDGGDEAVGDCPICLGEICGGMMVAIMPCSHVFHRDCMLKSLPKTNRCPFCRSFCATLI